MTHRARFSLIALLLLSILPVLASTARADTLVTKRFGETATSDATGVTQDGTINADDKSGDGAAPTFYYRYHNSIVMRYNLGSIPQGTHIEKAVVRLFYDYDYYDGGTTGVNVPIFRLEDPSGTGLWDQSQISYNNKRTGVAWSASGDASTAVGPQIGSMYFKNWIAGDQQVLQADLTSAVQYWVDNPSKNLGFIMNCAPNFNKRVASSKHTNPLLRPYIEITYSGEQDETIPQASAIGAKFSDGQTFITWKEAVTHKNETSYRIYRSTQPITTANLGSATLVDQVYQGSSYVSDSMSIAQPDMAPIGLSLAPDSGMYVYTAKAGESAYYAVTTVVEGNENRTIAAGANASTAATSESVGLPRPFFLAKHTYGYYTGFVIWLGKFNPADPSDPYGFDSRKSAPFVFSVAEPLNYSANKMYPLTLYLHAWSHTYFDSAEGRDNSIYYDDQNYGGYTVGIDDSRHMIVKMADGTLQDIGTFLENDAYGHSFYSGWNSNYVPGRVWNGLLKSFDIPQPFEAGKNVLYVEKSMRYVLEWMMQRSPWAQHIDANRVYSTGASMGGCGSLAFAVHNPDLIVAGNAELERTALYFNGGYSFNAERQFGTREMAIPVPSGENIYDYMDLAKYVRAHLDQRFPAMRLYNGKTDTTIPWAAQPDFFAAANAAGMDLYAHWDQGAHGTVDPGANFPEYTNDRYFPRDQALPYFDPFQFKRNKSYPAFVDFSLNDDPGSGDPATGAARGGINRYVRWDPATVNDQLTSYGATLFLLDFAPQASGSVTVIPSDIQNLIVLPASQYTWRNIRLSDGAQLQSGTAAVDAHGRIRIPGVLVSKTPSRLAILLKASTDTTKPSAPTGLGASALNSRTARLTWNPSTDNVGVKGYRIYQSNGTWLANVASSPGVASGLTPSTAYTFQLSAYDASGNESDKSSPIQLTLPGDDTNHAPVLSPVGDRSVNRGEQVRFTVSGYDADDFSLTYSADPLPAGAQFDPLTREFRWIPTFDEVGPHAITFRVSDGKLTTNQVVTLTVLPAAPPVQVESVQTYGAFVSGGVNVKMSGADGNEQGKLFIRKTAGQGEADATWKEAHPFVRYDANHMATSLFDLTPGTHYDLKVQIVDPEVQTADYLTSVTTRREWALTTATRTINVANDAALAAAVTASRPGDHILLAPGVYQAQVYFNNLQGGTAAAPIVLRSQDLNHRALLRGGLLIYGTNYVTVYGIDMAGGGGVKIRGSQHAEIVNNTIRDAGGTIDSYLVHLAHNELIPGPDKNFYALIMNNILADDDNSNTGLQYGEYPDQTYYGIKQDDGVGGMTIIRGNTIRGVADGMSPGGDEGESPILGPLDSDVLDTWTNQNIDIYDNYIYGVSDDAIETDGHMINGRIFKNHIGSCVNAISVAPVWPGPYFIVRNTIYGYREQCLKTNTAVPGGTRNVFFYQNTVKQKAGATYCYYRGMPAKVDNITLRNNIFEATGRVIDTDIGSNSPCEWYHKNDDFDYDLFWSDLPNTGGYVLFKWGFSDYSDNQRFNTFEAFQAGTEHAPAQGFTCPDQRAIPEEANGHFADPHLALTPVSGFNAGTSFLYDIVPGQGSPAIDKAVLIPGINDNFVGAGPDVGAVELQGAAPIGTDVGDIPVFRPRVTIDKADADSAAPGAIVTLWGAGFGRGQQDGTLRLGARIMSDILHWDDNRIDFRLPNGTASGDLYLTVYAQESNRIPFAVRSGAIYYVDNQAANANDNNAGSAEQPWRTLAGAVRYLSAGDTLYIGDGVYQERLIPLTGGTQAKPIVFKARQGAHPILDGSTLPGRPSGIFVSGANMSWLVFSGLTIRNFDQGILIAGGAHDCKFYDMDASAGSTGVSISGAFAITMEHSSFHNNSNAGVKVAGGAAYLKFEYCDATGNGTLFGGGFLTDFTALHLTMNWCKAENNFGPGFDVQVDGAALEGCRALRNTYGFQLWRNAAMRNCEATDNLLRGIALNKMPDLGASQSVSNCTVAGAHADAGIEVMPEVLATIVNTISVGSTGPALVFDQEPALPVVSHSILQTTGPPGSPAILVSDPSAGEGEPASGLAGDAGHNLFGSPAPEAIFKDYASRDLELGPASEAHDLGDPDSAPAIDILRRPRIAEGGRISVGAYASLVLPNAAGSAWALYQ